MPRTVHATAFALLFVLSLAVPAAAEEAVTRIIVAGPSWAGFTNRDGTGLYHEILRGIFAPLGIEIVREYMPSPRAYERIAGGLADMQACSAFAEPPLILARHPMYEGDFHVLYKTGRIGPWRGLETLRNRKCAWRIAYYDAGNFPVPVQAHEVKTGREALDLILRDRVDFYVDDGNLIRETLSEVGPLVDPSEFGIRAIGRRAYRPVFSDTPRGRRIRRLYDEGIERLYHSGRLREIFEKWGQPLPHYDIP